MHILSENIALPGDTVDLPDSEYNFGFADASRFLHAFLASLSVIIVSELGDKTFFIAAIMAMKNSRTVVFVAAMLALVIMTILASAFGAAITVIPRQYIHYSSIALFVVFGLKMLKEAYDMSPDEAKEEYENVQSSLEKRDAALSTGRSEQVITTEDPETGLVKSVTPVPIMTKIRRKMLQFVSLIFIETFTMIFLAEWGDRSQISTVILAAREDVVGVALGSLSGHFLCTGLAVLGGRVVAQLISVKTVTYVGGIVFLICATVAYVTG
ncbi:Transmembrane protein [Fragariocoptes setiger]|uniref:GDT1 family protein n=1 Tax=Fragariocoptes setiger TaxID=1670756 RepID=A0ABQ7S8Y3_9ACAR|nr:Transmembrane protein [Fragariocoptes setiger]